MPIDDTNAARINTIDQMVYQKTGQSLTNLQRLILRECWHPSKKTYEEIAAEHNYSARYIQQRVAPSLWQLMSDIVGVKVTKSNCRSVLFRYLEETEDIQPKGTIEAEKEQSRIDGTELVEKQGSTLEERAPGRVVLEQPTESVPLESPYYVPRGQAESRCYEFIDQPGALIRIKAPRQMGKTSLMNRIIAHAQQYPAVILNFQQVDGSTLNNLNKFLRWVCANVARQLGRNPNLDQIWDEDIGSKMSCTLYIEECILESTETPIILAIEESSRLFDFLDVSQEFFSMLRTWHEYTKHDATWQRLRLILVQSTEAYMPLNINQSPFNVGFEVALAPFDRTQVYGLVRQHQINIDSSRLEQLMNLLGGHPYLTRLALYHLVMGTTTWDALFTLASTDEGLFHSHLHRHLWHLQQQPELIAAFKQVVQAAEPVQIAQAYSFKLHSMGLVNLEKNQVQVSCRLYQQYFSERL